MWGEIEYSSPLKVDENIDLSGVIEQAQRNDCLFMYEIPTYTDEVKEIELSPMDSRMLYAAALHQYMSNMTDVIHDAEMAVEYNLVMPSEMPTSTAPGAPSLKKSSSARRPIHFIDKEYSLFSMGFGSNPPNLSDSTRRQVESRCIATMLAHIGFKSINSNVLEVLTDVFETFMKKICNELRNATDSILTGETCGFPDIIELVLTENGLGGVRGVCEYYEKRIKKYEKVLKDRCQTVKSRYELLLAPGNVQTDIKKETTDETVETEDIPEVHFTTMDGEEGYLQPFLESGFQMLNSLEEGQYTT